MATLQVKPPFLWSAGILWPTACTAVVAARFATRRAQGNRYGLDDWLILPAWALTCVLSAFLLWGVAEKAMGYPTPVTAPGLSLTSTSREQTITRKVYWVYLLVHTPALAFVKLSCIAFYRRVFRTVQSKTTDIVLYILVAIVTGWGIAFTVTALFTCGNPKHLYYLWTSLENQLKCPANLSVWQRGLSVSDVITDLLLLIFPMPDIWKLNMRKSRKLGLSVIFLFGSLSIAASTVRLVIVLQALNVEFTAHIDEDFLSTDAAYFMLLEAGFGITAICLPTLAGVLHLEGIETFFANASRILSISSRSSRSASNDPAHDRGDGDRSAEELTYRLSKTNYTLTRSNVVALTNLSDGPNEQTGVKVTKTVELLSHEI